MKKLIIGVTGASGSVLAYRLCKVLLELQHEVHLVATINGQRVWDYELEESFASFCAGYQQDSGRLVVHANDNLFAAISSGSFKADAMVILPCSMGTLAKVAIGLADSLLTRAADVVLKEHRSLLLVPRETPLSAIHLENMLKLSRLGVMIMPPIPAFYHKPQTLEESIDLTIGRILESLEIENPYHRSWRGLP